MEWISTKDKLPPEDKTVLVQAFGNDVYLGGYDYELQQFFTNDGTLIGTKYVYYWAEIKPRE